MKKNITRKIKMALLGVSVALLAVHSVAKAEPDDRLTNFEQCVQGSLGTPYYIVLTDDSAALNSGCSTMTTHSNIVVNSGIGGDKNGNMYLGSTGNDCAALYTGNDALMAPTNGYLPAHTDIMDTTSTKTTGMGYSYWTALPSNGTELTHSYTWSDGTGKTCNAKNAAGTTHEFCVSCWM
jgi:hypothetical protein